MTDVTIVCPSHGRAGHVTTYDCLGPDLLLCVPAAQLGDYRAAHPAGRYDAHPDTVVGIAAKRQWMLDRYGSLFMVDDDARPMIDLTTARRVDPPVAVAVIRRAADTARQLGAYLFGTNEDANPLHFHPARPFRLSGEVTGGQWGLLDGHGLRIPPTARLCEDMVVSALNAFRHRRAFVDLRYSIPMRTGQGGGIAGDRTRPALWAAADYLVGLFGDAIKLNPDAPLYPWRLKVPW